MINQIEVKVRIDEIHNTDYDVHLPFNNVVTGVSTNVIIGPIDKLDIRVCYDKLTIKYRDVIPAEYVIDVFSYKCVAKIVLSIYRYDSLDIVLKDILEIGKNGGTNIAKVWTTRRLNTVEANRNIELLNDEFTLTPGKYKFSIKAAFHNTGGTLIRLVNKTDNTVIVTSQNHNIVNCENIVVEICSVISYVSHLAIEYYCDKVSEDTGLGYAIGLGDELYTVVMITIL